MLTIAVNGAERKLNIGCRTFVFLDEILRLLGFRGRQVSLNGRAIPTQEVAKTTVNGGDSLELR